LIWSLPGYNELARIQGWAMLLVSICMFARASEVTQFCPTVENTNLPESASQFDSDGLPKWIDVGLMNWKTRSPSNRGKRYGFRLHRNYLDSRFCPVTWLLVWLHFSGITTGPLFQTLEGRGEDAKPAGRPMSERAWEHFTKVLFTTAGLYTPGFKDAEGKKHAPTGVTNHGIRRSAAQWAGRCHGQTLDVACNGRWKALTEMLKYMAQGHTQRERKETDDGSDPIFSMWVWKPVTVGAESTRNEL